MRPHFIEQGDVRHFIHAGECQQPRLLEQETARGTEWRVTLVPGTNVGEALGKLLATAHFSSGVGRLLSGGASHLAYHRMVVTQSLEKPFDYGAPIVLDGYITFISGALTIGRDATGTVLLHCHAGFIDRDGVQHGGHLVLNRLVVGGTPLTLTLCLFQRVRYEVTPDSETLFNLLHPVIQEAS